jgi:hypothetical protein
LDWGKGWTENRTWERDSRKALVEKDSQGAPKKLHIKEKVPDDLPTGDIPIVGVIKLGHDLKRALTNHFAVTALDERFDFFVCVHCFTLSLSYRHITHNTYQIPHTKKKFLSL